MSYLTAQEEIRSLMLKNGISYEWLAERLHTYYQKIQYAVEKQSEMPLSMYMAIMGLFEKHGFIQDSAKKCETLIELSFKANAKIGDVLKKVNNQTISDTSDKKFTPDERLKARIRLEDRKKELNEMMDEMIKATYSEED